MAAAGTFHGVRPVIVSEEQGLHLAQFERAQHPPQARHSAVVALSLAEHLPQHGMAALVERLAPDAGSLLPHLVFRHVAHISREVP